uniref:Uncharacterized protein n=1 Tax=Steinernema glaseri TaxID=37863 RepID=A0A1I7Z632_9BILA
MEGTLKHHVQKAMRLEVWLHFAVRGSQSKQAVDPWIFEVWSAIDPKPAGAFLLPRRGPSAPGSSRRVPGVTQSRRKHSRGASAQSRRANWIPATSSASRLGTYIPEVGVAIPRKRAATQRAIPIIILIPRLINAARSMASNKGSFKRSESSKSETKSTYDAAAMAINHIVEITKDSTLGRSIGSSEELRGGNGATHSKPVNPKALKTKSVSAISVKGPFTTIKENEKKKKGSVDLQAIDQDDD